jgi:hypothetical protein
VSLELLLVIALIVGVVWAISRMLKKDRKARKAELDYAWRVVLSDPNYSRRRLEEERKWNERFEDA